MAAPMGDFEASCGSENHLNSLPHGVRKFYQIPESNIQSFKSKEKRLQKENLRELLHYVNDNIVGRDFVFAGPWGPRKSK